LHKPLGHSMIFELGRHSGGLGVPSSNLGAPTIKTPTNQRLYRVARRSCESTNRGQKGGILTYSATKTTGVSTGALRAFSGRSRGRIRPATGATTRCPAFAKGPAHAAPAPGRHYPTLAPEIAPPGFPRWRIKAGASAGTAAPGDCHGLRGRLDVSRGRMADL
jgi:hypothetical protein